jgi:cyclohexadienyl dehydratase
MKRFLPLALLVAAGSASAQSHLDKVIQQGTLEVCTTGDYKPYTFQKEDGSYEGIDIAMAESLAASLGAKVKWVPVTWKSLTDETVAGIVISRWAASRSRCNASKAAWSSPTRAGSDGKIPLVRCDRRA